MKLNIAGGCGEHGRNCFHVTGDCNDFLVDCGIMAGEPGGGYPRLEQAEIANLQCVFLTHSHADHTGALPWLWQMGFVGKVIASWHTLAQLPFPVPNGIALEDICPGGAGSYQGIQIQWGRSGHCAGSVWYRFTLELKTILFSGDYAEDTLTFICDPIRKQRADLAVLDCAYGRNSMAYTDDCARLLSGTRQLLAKHSVLVFPVPKYGRSLELLQLFWNANLHIPFYGDQHFLKELKKLVQDYKPWCKSTSEGLPELVMPITEMEETGIVFLSDPQLRTASARSTTEDILSHGGYCVMTGTAEKGSYSAQLLEQGEMDFLRYPVHLGRSQYEGLIGRNDFAQAIPYHSPEDCVDLTFSF